MFVYCRFRENILKFIKRKLKLTVIFLLFSTFGIVDLKWHFSSRATCCTMASSFGGGIAGLAGCYILFGGKINVPFIVNCILGSLASIAGNCYYGTFYKPCCPKLPFLESL